MDLVKNAIRLAALGIMVVACQSLDPLLPGLAALGPGALIPVTIGAVPTASPAPIPTGTGSGSDNGGAKLGVEEGKFLTLINDYRALNGLGALQISPMLEQDAMWMAGDMASKSYLNHTDSLGRDPFVRMQAFGFSSYSTAGENIADGNALAADTFTQWKNSPGHNANMLGQSYKFIGIGRANNPSSSYGWYWSTPFGG